jgi:transcriptional regulator with XRE-family HTH domain
MEVEQLEKSGADSGRKEHLATAEEPFHFVDSGLDNVYLVGIRYFVDREGKTIAEIPAIKQLMQLIAYEVVTAPRDLSGSEIRFLRKRLYKKASDYCTYLGLTPETLSRIENEKQAVSPQSQKLARLSYCVFSEDPNLVECAKSIFQSILVEITKGGRKARIVLEMDGNQEWRGHNAA